MEFESYSLPSLTKRIIYLDQHVISHMAKALHPDSEHLYGPDDARTQHGFWRTLFGKLDRLSKLQLVVCPESEIQRQESLLDSRLTETLRTMYEHFAGGVRFQDPGTIQRFETLNAFRAWLDGSPPKALDPATMTDGRLDEWQDRIRVSVHWPHDDAEIARTRRLRDAGDATLKGIVERWRSGPRREFAEAFEEQCEGSRDYFRRGWPVSMTALQMKDALEDRNIDRDVWASRTEAFFASPDLPAMFHIQTGAALMASLAVRASKQQAATPTPGMLYDFKAISNFLAYSDAMFVDRECYSLISDPVVSDKLPTPARRFSVDQRDDFLAYLDDIEASAPAGHRALVDRVYGDGWLKPFDAIYTWRDRPHQPPDADED